MTTTDVQIDDWVIHRPNVVRSVAARVPGIDAEEAASRALEKMIRIVNNDGEITDPAAYWRRAALNEAYSITREAGRAVPVEDEALADITPAVAGAELDAEREADVAMLRDALSDLNDDDRKLLFDRHVDDMAVTEIAGGLGVRPHAVTMRLRRAEERLAGAFAAAHARKVNEPDCRTTRAAMHDYLKGRLLPRRSKRLEAHMDACAECTRAFVDVREVSWMLRELGQHLAAFFFGGAAVSGAATLAGAKAKPEQKRPTPKQTAVAASVLALLVLAGGAWAYMATEPEAPAEAASEAAEPDGGSGDGAGDGAGAGDDGDPAAEGDEPEPEPEEPPADPPEQPREEFPPPVDRTTPEEPVEAAPPAGERAPAPAGDPAPADDPPPAPQPQPQPEPEPEPEPEQPDPGNNGGGNDGGDGNGQGDGNGGTGGGLDNVLGGLPLGGLENVLGGLGDVPIIGDVIGLPVFGDLANALGLPAGTQAIGDATEGLGDAVGDAG